MTFAHTLRRLTRTDGGQRLAAVLFYLMVVLAAVGGAAATVALVAGAALLALLLLRPQAAEAEVEAVAATGPIASEETPPSLSPSPAPQEATTDGPPVLDPAYLDDMRQWVGDETLLNLLATAPDSFNTELASIRLAWNSGNAQAVRENAHRLKGAAGSVGCRRLADMAQALQKMADGDLVAIERLDTLEQEVASAIAAATCWRPA